MLWGRVWSEFSDNRERDRTGAYLAVLRALSAHGADFVPALIQPKDYADMIIHLESFIKQDVGAKQGSAIEHLQRFLDSGNIDVAVAAPPVLPVPSGVVN